MSDSGRIKSTISENSSIIEPLELGNQVWENGRLISFKCYWSKDFTCGLSGEIPPEIGNLTNLQYLDLNFRKFFFVTERRRMILVLSQILKNIIL